MKTKLLAILTSVLMLVAMLSVGAMGVSASTTGETGDCAWVLDGTHLTISGNGAMGDYSGVNKAPWGKEVTSVVIEEGVTYIGVRAFFECKSLTELIIPNTVATIGGSAFAYCDSLTYVNIPVGVTTINGSAFYKCNNISKVYYAGSEAQYMAMTIGSYNTSINFKKWVYNCNNPKDNYLNEVSHSVMDTDNGSGLAFRFTLLASGLEIREGTDNRVVEANATVNYLGTECKLIAMGAVLTNKASVTDLTLDAVDNDKVLKVRAKWMQDIQDNYGAFAVRVVNIPAEQLEREIAVRPYYVIEVEGEQLVVYGDVDVASCADFM